MKDNGKILNGKAKFVFKNCFGYRMASTPNHMITIDLNNPANSSVSKEKYCWRQF